MGTGLAVTDGARAGPGDAASSSEKICLADLEAATHEALFSPVSDDARHAITLASADTDCDPARPLPVQCGPDVDQGQGGHQVGVHGESAQQTFAAAFATAMASELASLAAHAVRRAARAEVLLVAGPASC